MGKGHFVLDLKSKPNLLPINTCYTQQHSGDCAISYITAIKILYHLFKTLIFWHITYIIKKSPFFPHLCFTTPLIAQGADTSDQT